MANRKCSLTKRVRTPHGMRYYPVVEASNHRIKSHVVMVDGREEKHEEGAYYLEWREGTKRVRLSVGNDPTEANARRLKKQAELNAILNGVPIASSDDNNGRRLLSAAITEYLEEIKLRKKPKTHAAYDTSLRYFSESCHRLHVEEITRADMLKFAAFLRDEKDQAARSCWNKFSNVMSFLKWCGIRGMVNKNDWPRFTEEDPEIYEQEDLDALFKVCDDDERLWFEFFLFTGMREQEVMHTYWSDVNLKKSTVKVSHKSDRNWTPKAYKGRTIPIPPQLVESLKKWKARADGRCELVFSTKGCNPKLDFLDCLKTAAKRAGLDERDFWLHKFRATFATRWLAKTDLRTVQQYLGHSDLESTMRYLRPAEAEGMTERAASVWNG